MSSEFAVRAQGLSKHYALFDRPADRLKQMLFGRLGRRYYREFWALRGVDLEIRRGEVVGIVGRNGAGKSTLLQLVCGTLRPTTGGIEVNGRVAALLELGAGFNPNFTGRENVYLNAAILGLPREEVDARLDGILAFADIGDFIDQPVKVYSSGMFVRLAFAVATSVDPDILVIDEALSVGDGAFARKSFDRIMQMKDAGKTILFCSHSMYQVEVLCSRAIWLEQGELRLAGSAADVTCAYQAQLNAGAVPAAGEAPPPATTGTGRIVRVTASADGVSGQQIKAVSGRSDVSITIEFSIDPALPVPSVALAIDHETGLGLTSAVSAGTAAVTRDGAGKGQATVVFPQIPLLKGKYHVTAALACEQGLHLYDIVPRCLTLDVSQEGKLQGVVRLPHRWQETA